MGIQNVPAIIQRLIQWVLRDVESPMVYIDDVLVGSRETEGQTVTQQHMTDCCEVL